jgi:precorrin-6B methylase 2
MKLTCENTHVQGEDPCIEFLGGRTSALKRSGEACFAQSLQQRCTQMELANFLHPMLISGLLLDNDNGGQDLLVETKGKHPVASLNVLVLGASCGGVPAFVKHSFPNSRITAVDIDPAAIFAARHFFDGSAASDIDYVLGDALKELLRQPDKSLDFVLVDAYDPHDQAPGGLYHNQTLSIAKSKLRAGGRIVLTLIDRSVADTRKDLESMGFATRSVTGKNRSSFPAVGGTLPGASPVAIETKALSEIERWMSDVEVEH